MKTDKEFNNNNENVNNDSILNNITKHDNSLQRLFNMINKFNAETSQYVNYCDNLNSKIKKDFSEIRDIVNDKINFILKEYSQTSDKMKNEHIKLKSEISFLQAENEEILKKIVTLKEKIAKMEKMIGNDLKDKNGDYYKTN